MGGGGGGDKVSVDRRWCDRITNIDMHMHTHTHTLHTHMYTHTSSFFPSSLASMRREAERTRFSREYSARESFLAKSSYRSPSFSHRSLMARCTNWERERATE